MDEQTVITEFPVFFSVKQFAELNNKSESHIQHAARNFIEPGCNANRASLPEGWRALKWGKVYVIYADEDHNKMMNLFSVEQ
jgi:hypothetical protein